MNTKQIIIIIIMSAILVFTFNFIILQISEISGYRDKIKKYVIIIAFLMTIWMLSITTIDMYIQVFELKKKIKNKIKNS